MPNLAEEVRAKYESRILAVLNKIRTALTEAGWNVCEPFELDGDEEARWDMVARPPGISEEADRDEVDYDISFTICTEAAREGEPEEGGCGGIAFLVDFVHAGGRMVGGMSPGNYTEALWLKDASEIEERFKLFEEADPTDAVDMMSEDFDHFREDFDKAEKEAHPG